MCGKKFDMRIYALVLSYSPLKVYMHRGGFCRFSAARYSCDKDSMKNLCVHLTNIAIQKQVRSFEALARSPSTIIDMALHSQPGCH